MAEQVQYFPVPKGDHPHDVAPAPDGTVWYTGQFAGVLGRLDPKTGEVERIRLGEGSRPHGVIVGPDGAPQAYAVFVDDKDKVWVSDFASNAIVKFDPKTRAFESFPSDMPGAAVRQMLGRPGEMWGAESGTGRLVVIRE